MQNKFPLSQPLFLDKNNSIHPIINISYSSNGIEKVTIFIKNLDSTATLTIEELLSLGDIVYVYLETLSQKMTKLLDSMTQEEFDDAWNDLF